MELPSALPIPIPKNLEKNPPEFPQMKLSDLNIKKNSYILSKESFSYVSENGTLRFSA